MVRLAGFEPARLSALPPQSSVSASSTISATGYNLKQARLDPQVHFVHPRSSRWRFTPIQ
jgi:hypothetical protein